MPVYTYVCEKCAKEKEVLCEVSQRSEKIMCCDMSMKKRFGTLILNFTGHGFHATDYKRLENIHKDAKEHVKKEDPSIYDPNVYR